MAMKKSTVEDIICGTLIVLMILGYCTWYAMQSDKAFAEYSKTRSNNLNVANQ